MNVTPLANNDPPEGTVYQLIVPADAVAPRTTVPVPQRDAGEVPVIVGTVVTVAVTKVLVGVVQIPEVAST